MKHLMSGNEATARGVYEAGIKVCSAYPGTPSTEILENLPQYGKDVCRKAVHRRTAFCTKGYPPKGGYPFLLFKCGGHAAGCCSAFAGEDK